MVPGGGLDDVQEVLLFSAVMRDITTIQLGAHLPELT